MEKLAPLLAAEGITDEQNRLLSADTPLADLQIRCGGSVPGVLAVPELLEIVEQSRAMGLKLAREFSAYDGRNIVTGYARVHPLPEKDGGGCELIIENWHRSLAETLSADAESARLVEIDKATAEVILRLDASQKVQLVSVVADDAADLQAQVAVNPGEIWTEYLEWIDISHAQPIHWRLFDGVACKLPGSRRSWTARIVPIGNAEDGARGFELLLVADQPLLLETEDVEDNASTTSHTRLIGTALTPALRQPVARIIANAETVRSKLAGPLRAEYAEYAGTIASAGQHLTSMLEDLADLEVVESPDFKTAREAVDLADIAKRAGGILGVRAKARSITITYPDEAEKRIASAEFRRVLQILINLVGNAVVYSPQDSLVRIEYANAGKGKVGLSVIDEGPGVNAEQASRIFEKFERLGREDGAGSGLGLYISRRLALAMGGDLTINAGVETGANFTLVLPAFEPEKRPEAVAKGRQTERSEKRKA